MIAPFDIFKVDQDGTLLWCGTADSLDEAKEKVRTLKQSENAEYMIFSQKTGNRIVIHPQDEITDKAS